MSRLSATAFDAQTAAAAAKPEPVPCPVCGAGFLRGVGVEKTRHPTEAGGVKVYFNCRQCGHDWTLTTERPAAAEANHQVTSTEKRPDGREFIE